MLMEWIPFPVSNLSLEMLFDKMIAVWFLGLVLLLVGARYYQLLIMAPGFAIGALLAHTIVPSASSEIQLLIVVVVGVIGAVFLMSLEKLSVALAGAFVGVGVLELMEPYVFKVDPPFYVPAIAALIGSMAFPRLYEQFKPAVTASAGALCVAWSTNNIHETIPVIVIACLGALVQHFVTVRRPRKSKTD